TNPMVCNQSPGMIDWLLELGAARVARPVLRGGGVAMSPPYPTNYGGWTTSGVLLRHQGEQEGAGTRATPLAAGSSPHGIPFADREGCFRSYCHLSPESSLVVPPPQKLLADR